MENGGPQWREIKLGALVETLVNGGTPSTNNPSYWQGTTPWISGADIVDQKVTEPRRYLSTDGTQNGSSHVVPAGTVLVVTRTGVGKVAMAPCDLAISQDFTGLIPRSDLVIGKYLYWWLASHPGKLGQLRQGTSINGILRNDLEELSLSLPPLSQQKAIVETLDSIATAIEKTEAVIAATEKLRSVLLEDLLTRGVPGWHTEWKQVAGLGRMPAGWASASLGAAADVQTGRAVGKLESGSDLTKLPYLSVANVKDGYLDLTLVKTMMVSRTEIGRFSLQTGDVLFTEGGDADKLGRGCVWRGEIEVCLHQNHIFAVRPKKDTLRPEFLAAYARSTRGKGYFLSCAKQTTNLASINSSQLKDFPLPILPIDEQDKILAILGNIPLSAVYLQALRAVKSEVADALMTGRVAVSRNGLVSTLQHD